MQNFVALPLLVEDGTPSRNLYVRIDTIESVCEQDGFCTVAVRSREHPYPIALDAAEVMALTATEIAMRDGQVRDWVKNGAR